MNTYISINNETGNYHLTNGNSESSQSWKCYNDALQALMQDDELQGKADDNEYPELYYNNTEIEWVA